MDRPLPTSHHTQSSQCAKGHFCFTTQKRPQVRQQAPILHGEHHRPPNHEVQGLNECSGRAQKRHPTRSARRLQATQKGVRRGEVTKVATTFCLGPRHRALTRCSSHLTRTTPTPHPDRTSRDEQIRARTSQTRHHSRILESIRC